MIKGEVMASQTTKKVFFWAFLVWDLFLGLGTVLGLALYLPIGIIGLGLTTLYTLVVISIRQSIKGKKPIFNLFREGESKCKKCGYIYSNKFYNCPKCAKKEKSELPTYQEMKQAAYNRRQRKNEFWNAVGTMMFIDEVTATKQKKKDVWTKMETEGEWIDHQSEGHDLEDGYCIDCDSNIEDMF